MAVRDVWRHVFLVGTEFDQVTAVHGFPWDFSHLDADLSTLQRQRRRPRPRRRDGDAAAEGSGERREQPRPVYLFGSTEPQLVNIDGADVVTQIPVIVAVHSDVPPPATVGIKSVQKVHEEIVPMRAVKMGFFPMDEQVEADDDDDNDDGDEEAAAAASADASASSKRRPKRPARREAAAVASPSIYALKCEQRRAGLANLTEERVRRFDYVLPYIFFPDRVATAGDDEVDTVVSVVAELPGRSDPMVFEFDWELDELDEFVDEQLQQDGARATANDDNDGGGGGGGAWQALRDAIRAAVKARKQQIKTEREKRLARVAAMSDEERQALRTMRLVKYYPRNRTPDIGACKTKFINRYYGQASELR